MTEPWDWPTHCLACNALLMGAATKHAPDCALGRMVADFFEDLPIDIVCVYGVRLERRFLHCIQRGKEELAHNRKDD
jgi:hypothetical protein